VPPSYPAPLAEQLDALRARAEEPGQALVPMLRAVQRSLGWVSDDALDDVAARAGVAAEDAANIAAYFDVRRAPPPAARVVEVCVNVDCLRRGSRAILEACRQRLGVAIGETSADGRFLLQEIVCLKRCGLGPTVRINGEVFEHLTPARTLEIVLEPAP
jgi:NADH:ubiquinone oxidoreductase subunit E